MDRDEVFVIQDRVYGKILKRGYGWATVEWLADGFLFTLDLTDDEFILLDEDNEHERF